MTDDDVLSALLEISLMDEFYQTPMSVRCAITTLMDKITNERVSIMPSLRPKKIQSYSFNIADGPIE